MRNIQKSPEPKSLTEHRCNTSTDYDNYAKKDDLRTSLYNEQRGICCYCMQRIQPEPEKMKIEHWQCQDLYPERQLDYKNLLGACKGGEGQKKDNQHCDTKKGNLTLTFNPAEPSHDIQGKIQFLANGRIESKELEFDREINQVLNLNQGTLVRNRKAVIEALQQTFMQTNPSSAQLQKELGKWNGDRGCDLDPYCQVVVYYLRKKIAKMR